MDYQGLASRWEFGGYRLITEDITGLEFCFNVIVIGVGWMETETLKTDDQKDSTIEDNCSQILQSGSQVYPLIRLEPEQQTETNIVKSLSAVGRHFRVSQPAVSKWKTNGMPIEEDGTYNLTRITAWRL